MASGPASLLIVGGDSSIGRALDGHFSEAGWQVRATTRRPDRVDDDHPYLDLSAPVELPYADVVILSAAVARIADCEVAPDATRNTNVDGTLAVARQMAGQGAHIILLSSDKVFDGTKALRNRDDDRCPACEYGRQKSAAESGVLSFVGQGAVLRLSKVVEPGMDLLSGWIRDLGENRPITPFHDLYLAPVLIDLVCQTTERIAEDRSAGIYHCTGAEDRSYVDFAIILTELMDVDHGLVRPTSCDAANMPAAARPRHTTLEMGLEETKWGLTAPEFDAVCRQTIAATLSP